MCCKCCLICFALHDALEACGGVEVWRHLFLTSALREDMLVSYVAALAPGKEPSHSSDEEAVWAPDPIWTQWR